MKRIIVILTMALTMAFVNNATAQNQTTKVGKSTIYKVNEAQNAAYHAVSTYAWEVTNGTVGDHYEIVSGATTNRWEIRWLETSPVAHYTVRIKETRGGCETLREFKVAVTNDGFDAMVAYATGQTDDVCATASGTVITDVGDDADNSNDDFGSTNVEIKVALTDIAWKPAWNLAFDVNAPSAIINSVTLKSAVGTSNFTYATGNGTVEIAALTTEVIFIVNVKTVPGVAQDVDLAITSAVEQTTGNAYADSNTANNALTEDITIKPMPATTGIAFE